MRGTTRGVDTSERDRPRGIAYVRMSGWSTAADMDTHIPHRYRHTLWAKESEQSMAEAALREKVLAAIDDATGDILAVSKFIHAHPEIAMQEVVSSRAVADMLERYGFA